jgi:hypothetical protein
MCEHESLSMQEVRLHAKEEYEEYASPVDRSQPPSAYFYEYRVIRCQSQRAKSGLIIGMINVRQYSVQ